MSGFNHQPFFWVQANDPNFSSVVWLSGFEGSDYSTLIVDESSYAQNVNSLDNGAPWNTRSYISSVWAQFGTSSMRVTVAGQCGFQLSGARFARASGEAFSYEGFVRAAARSVADSLVLKVNDSGGNEVFNIVVSSVAITDGWGARAGGFGAHTYFTHTPTSPFVFVQAIIGTDDVLRVYLDTVLKYSVAVGSTVGICPVWIAGTVIAAPGTDGYGNDLFFDEWRITKGVARPIEIPSTKFPRY